jgi:MFS family permease
MTAGPESSLKPPPKAFRWIVLLFTSLAMFGNYYVYDSISPLAELLSRELGFSDANIGTLNSIYSLPNIFMVLIGGLIIDRWGTKRSLFFFAFVCLVGASDTASHGSLVVMAAGRLIFGLGAESQIVAINSAVAKWFRGRELSFALGLNLTLARLGSVAALNSPSWAREYYSEWQLPLIIAIGAALVSGLGSALYWLTEAHAERNYSLGQAAATDKVVLKDVLRFGRSYWYLVALCVTFYSAIFPFRTFGVKFLMEAHGKNLELASFLLSMLDIFAMVGTPLLGLLVDRVGRRSLFMMFGSGLLIPVFVMMAYTNVSPYVPMAMLGLAFSLVPAVIWPSVAYLVEQNRLGTAYGLMTMIQNIGLTAFNPLIGGLNDLAGASSQNPGGYAPGMWAFTILGFGGLLFAFLLRRRETGPDAHGLETIRAGKKADTD